MTDTQPINGFDKGKRLGKSANGLRDDGVVDIVRNGDVTRIVLAGEIDMVSTPRLRPVLEAECARRSETVLIDLSGVDYVDSHGLRVLVETHRKLADEGRRLVLAPPPDHVWRVFVLTGLDAVLTVGPDA